jgi:PPM family protein phosphatase
MVRTLPRFDFRVVWAGVSDVGRVRSNNEDVWHVEPQLSLFAVADGMGGHAAGEVAARLAVDALVESVSRKASKRALDVFLSTPTLEARRDVFACLREAADLANERVRGEAERKKEQRGMGCTLDAALLLRDRAFVVHAGDSRVYLGRVATTIQLTHDHGLHESLMAKGSISRHSPPPAQNPLVNAIGVAPRVQLDTAFVDLSRGDRLLLCTDGVHGAIPSEAELSQIVRAGTPQEAARSLIDTALVRGGRDNATALVIDIAERFVSRPEGDGGLRARDIASVRGCPLLGDLPTPTVLRALAAAVEVELGPGEPLPRTMASDLVAYVVLDGAVKMHDGRSFGASALLYPESLVGGQREAPPAQAETTVRALRLRSDDFREVCQSDVLLASQLFERLARILARLVLPRGTDHLPLRSRRAGRGRPRERALGGERGRREGKHRERGHEQPSGRRAAGQGRLRSRLGGLGEARHGRRHPARRWGVGRVTGGARGDRISRGNRGAAGPPLEGRGERSHRGPARRARAEPAVEGRPELVAPRPCLGRIPEHAEQRRCQGARVVGGRGVGLSPFAARGVAPVAPPCPAQDREPAERGAGGASAVAADDDLVGRDRAVHEAGGVRRGEGAGNGKQQRDRLVRADGSAGPVQLGERHAPAGLGHDDGLRATRDVDLEHAHQRLVPHLRCSGRPQERRPRRAGRAPRIVDELQRDIGAVRQLPRPPGRDARPLGDPLQQQVAPEQQLARVVPGGNMLRHRRDPARRRRLRRARRGPRGRSR